MTTFTVTGDWTDQGEGDVDGTVYFYPQPASAGSPASAPIAAGTLSTTLPVITGSYLVVFNGITLDGVIGQIASFKFASLASGTLDLRAAVSPSPTVVTTGTTAVETLTPILPASTAISSAVTLASSSSAAPIVALTLGSDQLEVGSSFEFDIRGTVQVKATSGTLTFSPYLGATVSTETYQMGTQSGAEGPVAFWLKGNITVRSVGASGSYVTNAYGRIELATPVVLSTTTATTAAVDTTATTVVAQVKAQWQTSNAANSLVVQTATIKRVN